MASYHVNWTCSKTEDGPRCSYALSRKLNIAVTGNRELDQSTIIFFHAKKPILYGT
jgi:hypothetical protein